MRRASLCIRLALLAGACAPLPALFACLDHPLKKVVYDSFQESQEGIPIAVNKDVDILFVIDNSGSMGEEQNNLSANFEEFLNVLEREDVRANYRIGITTTDNGNPACIAPGNNAPPEAGNLVLTSCLTRLDSFQSVNIDKREACEDFCDYQDIVMLPTATLQEPDLKPRVWLESVGGSTNLPENISAVDAFQCFGPQGIDGCGFESHLESMYKALTRTSITDQPSYGFLRGSAILAIVFVTDELDCSANPAGFSAFRPDGDRALWTNPDEGTPTSAVCWNAGVECTSAGGGLYEDCYSVERGVDAADSDPADAVLLPVQRYIDYVQAFEDAKQELIPDQQVLVAGIVGVPGDYPNTELVYQDAADATFQRNFGVGPGCSSDVAEAVPPVRIREFAEAFQVDDRPNLFSVCNTDYGPALEEIADRIRDQLTPACMTACVADQDQLTQEVEPSCVLTERRQDEDGNSVTVPIPVCADFDGTLPEGSDVCYIALGDKENATPETNDDLDADCIDAGWNLQFRVQRAPGAAAGGGTSVNATCQLSQNVARDCPLLPN